MREQGRVDLERMQAIYERERAALARATADQRARIVRAKASIDRDCHMVGRVVRTYLRGRVVAEDGKPVDERTGRFLPGPRQRA